MHNNKKTTLKSREIVMNKN